MHCKILLLTKWQRHASLPQAKVTRVLLNSGANQEISKGKSQSLLPLKVSADSTQAYTKVKWFSSYSGPELLYETGLIDIFLLQASCEYENYSLLLNWAFRKAHCYSQQ